MATEHKGHGELQMYASKFDNNVRVNFVYQRCSTIAIWKLQVQYISTKILFQNSLAVKFQSVLSWNPQIYSYDGSHVYIYFYLFIHFWWMAAIFTEALLQNLSNQRPKSSSTQLFARYSTLQTLKGKLETIEPRQISDLKSLPYLHKDLLIRLYLSSKYRKHAILLARPNL